MVNVRFVMFPITLQVVYVEVINCKENVPHVTPSHTPIVTVLLQKTTRIEGEQWVRFGTEKIQLRHCKTQ